MLMMMMMVIYLSGFIKLYLNIVEHFYSINVQHYFCTRMKSSYDQNKTVNIQTLMNKNRADYK